MSYTTNRQPQGLLKNVETLLREGMIAEIVAINDYSNLIKYIDNKEIVNILHDIMQDEKRHYGEFLEALRRIDKEQYKEMLNAHKTINIAVKDKIKEYIPGKGARSDTLSYIRELIKGELEAIALYENIIYLLKDELLIDLVRSITKEEKEHTEELSRVLILLDKDKYGPLI